MEEMEANVRVYTTDMSRSSKGKAQVKRKRAGLIKNGILLHSTKMADLVGPLVSTNMTDRYGYLYKLERTE
jgi:hypothetical protein